MRFNYKIFGLVMFVMLICCLSAASATDVELNSTNDDNILTQQMVVEEITETPSDDSFNEPLMIDSQDETYLSDNNSSIELYVGVGKNVTADGGNGSYENPFATLELACAKVSGEEKATVNIFNGTYYIGALLTFNTKDLTINGLDEEVIIKNLNDLDGSKQAFSITGANSKNADVNFTMNNIIMDASGWTKSAGFFTPFYHYANNVIYNDCTFRNLKKSLYGSSEFNTFFFNCIFVDCTSIFVSNFKNNGQVVYFENCEMLNVTTLYGPSKGKNITLNGIWFGDSVIPNGFLQITGSMTTASGYIITKYAEFLVTENYIGDNQYEIIGKLIWNGTDDTVGNTFTPKNVTLSSTTGDIQNSVMLTNGTFKVYYLSNSSNNQVTAQLDYELFTLTFTNLDIQIDAPNIIYGDAQKIYLNFSQLLTGIVNITVNNITYEIEVDNETDIEYTIKDVLSTGNHTINVLFIDEDNHLYGSNYTVLTISKVENYDFNPIIPTDVKVGDNETIIVNLPEDATGNISIQIGENNFFTKNASKTTEIDVNGFVEGNNTIIVVYSGDDKYKSKSFENIISVDKVEVDITNETLTTEIPKGTTSPEFSINLPKDATGNLTVTINGKDYSQELVNGSATVTISNLSPGTYNVTVTYSGDSKYVSISKNVLVSVPKPVLTAKNFSMLYTSGAKYTVCVTLDGKAVAGKKVSFTINGKKTTATTDKKGYASVKLSLPPKSKAYTVTATYLGVKVTNKVTVKSIVTAKNVKVKKSAKKLTIKVTLKKVNKKYLKGKTISLKFKGKTYKVKTNKKGVATFTIKKNVLKKLKVGKKYTYKVTYGKDVVNKKITVKK